MTMGTKTTRPANVDALDHIASVLRGFGIEYDSKAQTQLRGGLRDVSQTWSEGQVEIRNEHIEKSITAQGTAKTEDKQHERAPPARAAVSAGINNKPLQVKPINIPKYVPLDEHEISRVTYQTTPAVFTQPSVVSVANRKVSTQHQPVRQAINMLDFEPQTNPFTPTQQRVLQRMPNQVQAASEPESLEPFSRTPATHTFNEAPVLLESTSLRLSQAGNPSGLRSGSTKGVSQNDVGVGEKYDTLNFYDKIAQQHAYDAEKRLKLHNSSDPPKEASSSQRSVTPLNPVAEEFRTSTSLQVEDQQQTAHTEAPDDQHIQETLAKSLSPEVAYGSQVPQSVHAPESREDLPQELAQEPAINHPETVLAATPQEDRDESHSESGLDLAPVLKVLGARVEVGSPAGSSTAADIEDPLTFHLTEGQEPKTASSKPQDDVGFHTSVIEHESQVEGEQQCQARTVVLKQLPSDTDYLLLTKIVQGGRVEKLDIDRHTQSARVTFVNEEDARAYVQKHAAGIAFRHHGQQYKANVEILHEMTDINPILRAYHICGATRVIEVENMGDELTITALYKLAEGLFGRQVDCVIDTYKPSSRVTTFRFAGVQDAVEFRNMLTNAKRWKKHIVRFANDPCDQAC